MQSLQRIVQDVADQDTGADSAILKSVLDQVPYAAFVIYPPDRRVVWCNRAVEDLLGYSPDDLVGRNTRPLHVDERHYQNFAEKFYPSAWHGHGQQYRGRHWMRHKQGHAIPTDHLVMPVTPAAGPPSMVSFVQSLYGDENTLTAAATQKLSPAERETFDLMRQGYSAKHAARALGCSHRTVEVHRSRVLAKLGYASTTELLAALLKAKAAFSD